MQTGKNRVDYGIYIDREKAIIVAVDHVTKESLVNTTVLENHDRDKESRNVSQQEHVQHRKNEQLRKFCKTIINNIANANNITVFGPSTTKFELQKEIRETKRLKNVKDDFAATDFMDKEAAITFVKNHYHIIEAGHQVFTGRKIAQ